MHLSEHRRDVVGNDGQIYFSEIGSDAAYDEAEPLSP
jgi:hypothetical protein